MRQQPQIRNHGGAWSGFVAYAADFVIKRHAGGGLGGRGVTLGAIPFENGLAICLRDLQIFGVDQVKPSGVAITGQIACTDNGRWPVQREFNRRMKKRFEAEEITLAA